MIESLYMRTLTGVARLECLVCEFVDSHQADCPVPSIETEVERLRNLCVSLESDCAHYESILNPRRWAGCEDGAMTEHQVQLATGDFDALIAHKEGEEEQTPKPYASNSVTDHPFTEGVLLNCSVCGLEESDHEF